MVAMVGSASSATRVMRLGNLALLGVLAFAASAERASAQLYTPDPRIDFDTANNVFFGSTKDADGNFLSGVTASFKADNVTYVMTTDDAGRFKVHIPKYIAFTRVKFSCSKPGYRMTRATKRPPPGGASTPIQADCVLVPTRSKVK
jgi:hypothetical protein